MRNILFILLLCFLASCSGTRKLTSSSSSSTKLEKATETHENATITDKSATKRDSAGILIKSQVDSMYSDFFAKVTEYDTSKQTDPATGKPPVIRETELIYHRASSHHAQTDQQSKVSDQKQNNVKATAEKSNKSSVKIDDKKSTRNVEITKSGVPWWVIAGGTIIVVILIFLAIRFSWWGKFISFFQRKFK